jgi:hypothetical protein
VSKKNKKNSKKKIIAESKIKRQVELLKIAIHNIKSGLSGTEIRWYSSFLVSDIKKLEKITDELENIIKQKDRVKLSPVKIYKYVYPPMREDGTYPDPYSKGIISKGVSNEIKPCVVFDDPDCLRIYLMGFPHEKMYL